MITYYKKKIGEREFKILPYFEIGSWINVINPSEEEIDLLCKKFKLDKRNLFSGLDENEIPRLDFIKDNVYIFTKTILPNRTLQTFLIVIGKKFILTLSKEKPYAVEKILKGRVEFFTTQKLKSLIRILFLINEQLEKVIRQTVKEVQVKRKKEVELTENELRDLLEKEDFLNNLVSSYHYLSLLYERIIKRIKFFEQDKEMIKDLIEEIDEGFNLCKSSLKTISNIRDHYVVILSNRLNRAITILTVFTILIDLPAAISGIYGMNLILPLQENHLAFWYIMSIIGFTWIAFVFYLKRKKII